MIVTLGAHIPAAWAIETEGGESLGHMEAAVALGACPLCGNVEPAGRLLCGRRECARRFAGLPPQWQDRLDDYANGLVSDRAALRALVQWVQEGGS